MKIRIKFKKEGVMKFIGHLDVMRYFQKLLRRSGIPIAYSTGMSPHQIMSFAMPLSIDPEVPYDIIAMIAASAAIAISDIPWYGPIGAVRVCEIGDELVVNPSNYRKNNI